MKRSDFKFHLPEELIAQTPLQNRDESRLLCLDKQTGAINHKSFFELPSLLREGDCLVLNDSRVIPARLIGVRESGGAVELVLLRDLGGGRWECLSRPGKKVRPGTRLFFGNEYDIKNMRQNSRSGAGCLRATVSEIIADGNRIIDFEYEGIFLEILEKLGKMPLPPYIKRELLEPERYQTVYSRVSGSSAAPTAGLHFTKELLKKIEDSGVLVRYVTLHVGLGTFRPVKSENIEDHEMHAEFFDIPRETITAIDDTKKRGGRVIAVGTTSCRTLESFAGSGYSKTGGWTDIFIYPGYKFKCVDALITNFHLPESTLIMLVSALAGRENIMRAYEEAIREKYRFFSFGDAMLIGDMM